MIVAQRLKTARLGCRLTQSQVAEVLGIDRSAYTYYETGKTSPSLPNLLRLSALFGVDVAWLLGENREARDPDLIASCGDAFTPDREIGETHMAELSRDERLAVAFYRTLKSEGKEQALLEAFRRLRDSEPPADWNTADG